MARICRDNSTARITRACSPMLAALVLSGFVAAQAQTPADSAAQAAPSSPAVAEEPSKGVGATADSTTPSVVGNAVPASEAIRIPLVAVSPLEARGLGSDEAATIADNLSTRLQKAGKVRVMERSQMAEILKEQNFQQSGACEGGECAVEVGRVLGIDQMVVGSVGRVGNTWSLNLRLVSVTTGEALRTSTRNQQGSIDQVLTELVPDAALELSGEPVPERVAVAQPKRSIWPWIAGGTIAAGGAVAAAILLTSDDGSSSPSQSQDAPHFKISW